MRAQIIANRSSHTRRSHRIRNLVDDLRLSLEVIRLRTDLHRDAFSRNWGRAVVPFEEDPLTLVGRVGSMAERINICGMRKRYDMYAEEALGRRNGNWLNGYVGVVCYDAV